MQRKKACENQIERISVVMNELNGIEIMFVTTVDGFDNDTVSEYYGLLVFSSWVYSLN